MQGMGIAESNEWYTPLFIFEAINLRFDLDPCSPGPNHWVPADKVYTIRDNGLKQPWRGLVFMNPPFGGRNKHVPWLAKFVEHSCGIALVRAYTSAKWWHDWICEVDTLVFPRGKTKFIRPDGSIGKSPSQGIALLGIGKRANKALKECQLGMFLDMELQYENR